MDDANIKLIVDGYVQTAYQFVSCKLDSKHWRSLCVHDSEKVELSNSLNKISVQQLIEFYV